MFRRWAWAALLVAWGAPASAERACSTIVLSDHDKSIQITLEFVESRQDQERDPTFIERQPWPRLNMDTTEQIIMERLYEFYGFRERDLDHYWVDCVEPPPDPVDPEVQEPTRKARRRRI